MHWMYVLLSRSLSLENYCLNTVNGHTRTVITVITSMINKYRMKVGRFGQRAAVSFIGWMLARSRAVRNN
jgi:hypothetical protein